MASSIRVVVADDSPFICRLITNYLQASSGIEVVGTALNGRRAVQLVRELKPDAVTLDIDMPEMNGLEALDVIMAEIPTPVIMLSGVSRQAAMTTLKAIDMGAVDFILKYSPDTNIDPEILRQEIISKVKSASKIKVIRSIRHCVGKQNQHIATPEMAEILEAAKPLSVDEYSTVSYLSGEIVVIGASTGGPVAIRELLETLSTDFHASIIIVQHIPASFSSVLVAQMNRSTSFEVILAKDGDELKPGRIMVAPGDHHLLMKTNGQVELNSGPTINGHRPSIDVTMQSVAQVYGSRTTGVLLTGMGNDGAQGMVTIHAKKGKTYAQDAESCVVNGMPQRAIDKGVVDRVGQPDEIGRFLNTSLAKSSLTQMRLKHVTAE